LDLNWPCTETRGSFFLILTLYWDESVVVLDFDLVLRREGHCSWFWPCTETRRSLFLILTLYWDERVVVLDFDLVLRREGRCSWFWPCTEMRGSLFFILTLYWVFSFNNIFCWFEWSLIFPCWKMYVGCMKMHEFFFLFVLFKECIYKCMKWDFFFKECMLKYMKFVWIWIFDFVLFEKCI